MRRNKEAYISYVCPRCFNTVNKCTCKLYPPHALIMIDRGIQEHIRILNQKGYYTQFCCESHYQESYSLYIAFCRDYDFKTIPDGFKYSKNHNNLHCDFTKRMSESEYETIKRERLETLLEWCKSLENIKPEKPEKPNR